MAKSKRKRTVKRQNSKRNAIREDKASHPLDSTNIGYQILLKIGYKVGTGLGRQGTGITEPIPIIKRPKDKVKAGLGYDPNTKRRNRKKKKRSRKNKTKKTP